MGDDLPTSCPDPETPGAIATRHAKERVRVTLEEIGRLLSSRFDRPDDPDRDGEDAADARASPGV